MCEVVVLANYHFNKGSFIFLLFLSTIITQCRVISLGIGPNNCYNRDAIFIPSRINKALLHEIE